MTKRLQPESRINALDVINIKRGAPIWLEYWLHQGEVPATNGLALRDWLDYRVLNSVTRERTQGTCVRVNRHYKVDTPAGDLNIYPDSSTTRIVTARFVTAAAMEDHAAEYELHLPDNTSLYDGTSVLKTVERGTANVDYTFDDVALFNHDPGAVRLAQMIDLIRAAAL